MAQMRNVQKAQIEQVMSRFVEIVGDQTSLGVGSSYIRKMLTQALGEDKAGGLIDRILLGGNTSGLDSLKWMEPRAVADVIRYEHPQIRAIVVAYLDPDQAGEVLSHFDLGAPGHRAARVFVEYRAARRLKVNLITEAVLRQQYQPRQPGRREAGGRHHELRTAPSKVSSWTPSAGGRGPVSQIEDLMFVFDNLAGSTTVASGAAA